MTTNLAVEVLAVAVTLAVAPKAVQFLPGLLS